MKRTLSVLTLLLLVTAMWAQYPIGSWRQHRAYGDATDQVVADGQVFCLASGNLFVYNIDAPETRTLDTQSGLSSNGITHIDYDATTHTVIVAYADCTIDLIDSRTLDVTALTALRDKNLESKVINGISVHDGTAWLLMSFGYIEVNLSEAHFGETYDLKHDVLSAAVCGETLYYSIRGDGLYKVPLKVNMHDTSAHTRINGHVYDKKMMALGNRLYGMSSSTLNCFVVPDFFNYKVVDNTRLTHASVCDGFLVANSASRVVMIDSDGNVTTIAQPNAIKSIVRKGTTLWASCGLNGLQAYRLQDDALQAEGAAIIPNSPRYDYFYRMQYVGERLLVAGGAHEYTGNTYAGTASFYENETWTNLDTVMIGKEQYNNITGIAQHPTDPNRHYVSSMGHGVYVYDGGHLTERYNHTNSGLKTILPDITNAYDYVRVNAPTFDSNGNLWMLNCEVDSSLVCLTADGKWRSYLFPSIKGTRCPDGIYIDEAGRIWMLIRDMNGRGIFCYDQSRGSKGTLRSTITQQDGLSYSPDNFFCMTPDRDGSIWVGTERGLFIISDPDSFAGSDFTWRQIKVNRDDGSGLADYLLSGAFVSAIAVDGANRKWIGTVGDGAYLVSADGQQMLQRFTTADSPLPSDNIRAIAVNPKTGEVMIGTELGLVSYMSDATDPEPSLDPDNIVVFPNPVDPEYGGNVTIRGLVADCEVKIATITGQVVWSGRSSGGTTIWDIQKRGGGRVASGIYNIIMNTREGKDVVVSRIAVIR